MKSQQNNIISQAKTDLTEDELNRIFFGSNESVNNIDSSKPPVKKTKLNPGKPNKLVRKKTEEKANEEKKKSEKRKRGRPLKWTPEKIKQKKEENKRIAAEKRKKRSEEKRLSKIATNEPITHYERKKIISKALETKEEVEKEFTNSRTFLKSVQAIEHNPILRSDVCKNHLFKFRFSEHGLYVTSCDHCSANKTFEPSEWDKYMSKNRRKL